MKEKELWEKKRLKLLERADTGKTQVLEGKKEGQETRAWKGSKALGGKKGVKGTPVGPRLCHKCRNQS